MPPVNESETARYVLQAHLDGLGDTGLLRIVREAA
jgi:hypothetical protein